MSGRDVDQHRIRSAHHDRLDPEAANRVMDREFRAPTPQPHDGHAANRCVEADPGAVAVVAAAIARDAVVPDALAVACHEHDAKSGTYCFAGVRGVCADRIARRPRHVA
jgi:hypothetical protein